MFKLLFNYKIYRASTLFFILNYIIYLSSKEVRAKKPIHLPPKEEGVFLEILDKTKTVRLSIHSAHMNGPK